MQQLLDKRDCITNRICLADFFYKSFKPKSNFKIGIEFEKLGVCADTSHAIKYFDKNGAVEFLKRIKLSDDFRATSENGYILGLKGEKGDVTIEPGSQIEFSTKPFKSLKQAEEAYNEFNQKAGQIGNELGIKWIGLGIQPLSTYENIQMIPKARYDIMRSYLPTKGSKSPVMMLETAGTQTSIDYSSEADAMRKFRLSLGISPIMTAMFANSPIRGGKLTGYKSYRASGWLDTDNDRCGLVSRDIFEGNFGFTDYVDVLLDVPMFFIQRDNRLIDMTGTTFREYLKHGYKEFNANMDDWNLHMTTFFPDVRLKNYVEIRNCDCQKPDMAMAFPALIKGLFYNEESLEQVEKFVDSLSWEEINELRCQVPKHGLDLEFKGYKLADIAREFVSIAEHSLQEEAIYLEKLKELVSEGKTPADIIIKNWNSSWNGDIKKLIEYSSF